MLAWMWETAGPFVAVWALIVGTFALLRVGTR